MSINSFAAEIKKELLTQELATEQAHAFVQGLVSSSGQRDGIKTIIKLNNDEISTSIRDMLEQLKVKYTFSQENRNWIVLTDFDLYEKIEMPGNYFAGIFVGGGSISDPSSTSYHLELQFYSHQLATKVQIFLNKYKFNFSLIQRRKNWVLYIKKSEQIADFLRAIQAYKSLLSFEDERINRDFQNQLNRYSNLDIYNQNKLAKASQKFQDQFQYIIDHNLTSHFRDIELVFYELKRKNPYSSLEDLTKLFFEKTSVNKTRAGLSHYLIKLRKIVSDDKFNS